MKGKLYLLPCHLGDSETSKTAVPALFDVISEIDHYIVENIKTSRRWLRKLDPNINIDGMTFYELNKHTEAHELEGFLSHARNGGKVGLMSEAGSPAIADPGADIVRIAHEQNVKVIPIPGPSSILLALICSGMGGQEFTFNGYLPKERSERLKKLRELEKTSARQTQIFMETPFRAHHLFEDILNTCHTNTSLCVATDITLATESITTKTLGSWKKSNINLKKKLCVFVMGGLPRRTR